MRDVCAGRALDEQNGRTAKDLALDKRFNAVADYLFEAEMKVRFSGCRRNGGRRAGVGMVGWLVPILLPFPCAVHLEWRAAFRVPAARSVDAMWREVDEPRVSRVVLLLSVRALLTSQFVHLV
jgi:hypothetical protein